MFRNIKALLSTSLSHELISGSLFLFIGGLLGSFLSFLYNLFLARSLSTPDYGTYTSLLAFETLIIIPSASLTAVIVRFATHYIAKNDLGKASHLFKRMSAFWLVVGLLIFGVIYIFHPLILNYFHLKDSLLVLTVGLGIAIAYIGIVNTGFLQSFLKFRYIAFTVISGNLGKIIVGGFLVLGGYRVVGGLVGVMVLPLLIYLLGFLPLRSIIKSKSSGEAKLETGEIIRYGSLTALGVISLSSFISTDAILVKHFFDSTSAGLYGGLSVIGKVIFYFTAPIASVMFPLVVKKHTSGQNFKSLLYLSIILVLIPSVAIVFFYFLFPIFTVNLFLTKDYLSIAPYLALFGIFITLFSLVNVFANFFFSIRKTSVSFLVLIFAVLQIVLIHLFHTNFLQIIAISITSLSLLLIALIVFFRKNV